LLAVAVLAAGLGSWFSRSESAAELPRRFSIQLPEGAFLPGGVGNDLTISPDGSTVVYLADDRDQRMLYVRDVNEFESRPLPGTEGSSHPFFSPDGEWIGFNSDEGIKKISLASLEIYPICETYFEAASWGDDGNVMFGQDNALWRVPETGGKPERVVEPMPDKGISAMLRPYVLPGSQVVLFEIGDLTFGGVGVMSLESGEVMKISTNGSDPFYSPTGHIVFARENTLFAVPFDPKSFEVTGREAHVLQGVRVENGGALQAAVSENGLLIYAPSGTTIGTRLTWVDRQGNTKAVNDQWRIYTEPRISPSGDRIAAVVNNGGRIDVWIVDVGSGGMTPLTTSGSASAPVWTPDGTHVTFAEGAAPPFTIRSVSVEPSGQEETLFSSDYPIQPETWHPDGDLLVYSQGNGNLFVFDTSATTRTALFERDMREWGAVFSPDGKRLSYVSDKTGVDEVYLTSFPELDAEVLVSIGGGGSPLWTPDGSELFYRDDRRFTSASMDGLRVTSRDPAFDAVFFWWGSYARAQAAIHPDGERFLVLQKNEGQTRPGINVVLNWFDELNTRAPADR
jgi:serine/threonine-protein kinase